MKKLLFFLLSFNNFLVFSQTNIQDSLALVDLYWATDGPNWTNNNNWLTGPVKTWYGIAKYNLPGDTTRVVKVEMPNNNLNGNIPLSIGDLTKVADISLYDNNLTGTIPYTIGRIQGLRILHLFNNNLSGEITDSICRLTRLGALGLSYNNFTGKLPECINQFPEQPVYYIILLYLHNNEFTEIPDFSNHPNLPSFTLWAQNNLLTFESIEPNITIWDCLNCEQYYSPQYDSINTVIDTTVILDSSISLKTTIGGQNNVYQWYKDGVLLSWATDSILTINNVIYTDSGIYTCNVTNSIVPGLEYHRRPIILGVKNSANVNSIFVTNKISIIPNPFDKELTVKLNTELNLPATLSLLNSSGKTIMQAHTSAGEYVFNTEKLPAGLYLIKVETERSVAVVKVNKE